ncbi:MAG: FtsX-like permease family protein [Candidatus Yonathbacteria bacterium]|nr:FtsX-like permease family protein [Candidatus Yonathbacteria bacterium]
MKYNDILQETYVALSSNKARSGLTMLGIVIGISSVIAMVSIGQGAQSSIQSSIQSLGSNLVQVTPGTQRGPGGFGVSAGRGTAKTLTGDDADAIVSEIENISAASPELSGRYQITAKGTNTNTTVVGVMPAYTMVRNIEVEEGMFISDNNDSSAAKVAVIGPTTRDDLFGEGASAIGQIIRINKLEFKVIGVTVAKGGSGFTNQDDMIYIPLESAKRYLAGSDYVTSIGIQASSADVMTQVQEDITALLLARHHISDSTLADFTVLNQNDLLSTVSSVTSTFTLLLAAIAGISLVVGGIGIMNMMLTTVTERTREIGLRKAIGARRRDISSQFLMESVVLTLIGGVVGVIIGGAVSYGLTVFGILQTTMSLMSVFVAFGVSAAIGIIFGWYPARRAASLNPIEALRYE